jgi:hypothetical protein
LPSKTTGPTRAAGVVTRSLLILTLALRSCHWRAVESNAAISFAPGSAERQHDALLLQLPSHFLEPGIAVVKRDDRCP